MNLNNPNIAFGVIALSLIIIRFVFEFWLDHLNTTHVRKNAKSVPEPFKKVMDEKTYQKSVNYTLAKAKHGTILDIYSTIILITILFSGVLAETFTLIADFIGGREFAIAVAIWLIIWMLQTLSMPFSWYAQFRIEEKFGFNNSTQSTWWADQAKGLILSFII